ncbi:UNKNOWN [Stylonychia lemnae]|uniref:Transmembrane protein n=1 Tax=Stylonychia lemnae TaxID=5949 RepID=A0A078BCT9_STYLE|nr:UNKNOWN [Stylonychia lemnae]|eukprot:CDW91403.1 UNKNOWN [Stylonychia lemnae]
MTTVNQMRKENEKGFYYNPFEPRQWDITDENYQNQLVAQNFDFSKCQYPDLIDSQALQNIRKALLVPLISITVVGTIFLPLHAQLIYLTWWGHHLQTFTLIYCIKAGNPENKNNLLIKRISAICFQVSLTLQLIINLVYWTQLYQNDLAKSFTPDRPIFSTYFWWHKVLIHSLPAVTAVLNFILTQGVFIPGQAFYQIVLGAFYTIFNYFGVQYLGQPIYDFMDWKSYMSVVNSLIVFIMSGLIQQIICWFSIQVKTRPIDMIQSTQQDKKSK